MQDSLNKLNREEARQNFILKNGMHICIRPLVKADGEKIFKTVHASEKYIKRWIFQSQEVWTLQEAYEAMERCEMSWDKGKDYFFGIIDMATDDIIGSVSISDIHFLHKMANFGGWMGHKALGKGIAQLSTLYLGYLALAKIGLNRLEIVISLENTHAINTIEETPAQFEAVMHNRLYSGKEAHDAKMYSLTQDNLASIEQMLQEYKSNI